MNNLTERSNIYYNILINKDESDFSLQKAQFSDTRTQPIVVHPHEYLVTVDKLNISSQNIPLFLWKDNFFVLSIEFDNYKSTQTLQFTANEDILNPYGRAIWNIQEMLDSLNKALLDAYNDVKSINPAMPPSASPFMIYNNDSKLFELYAPIEYDNNNPTPTDIGFNENLYLFFSGLQVIYDVSNSNDVFTKIVVKSRQTNEINYLGLSQFYIMSQSYSSLPIWYDFTRLVITSSDLPIIPDIQSDSVNDTRQILFDVNINPLILTTGQLISYENKNQYVWKSLNKSSMINRITCAVFWVDKDDNYYPIYLNSNDPISIKLLFRRKEYIYFDNLNNEL